MQQPAIITTMPTQAPAGYTLPSVPPDTRSSPTTRPRFKARLATAVLQTILGVTAMICSLVVIIIRYPTDYYDRIQLNTYGYDNYAYRYDIYNNYNFFGNGRDEGHDLDRSEAWAIGIAVFVVFASCFGFCSKRKQAMISFYMVVSIIAALATFIGIFVAAAYVSRTARFKDELQRGLRSSINARYRTGACRGYPRYSSRAYPQIEEQYNACLAELLGAARSHLSCWIIILICFILEFIVGIVAASSTCPGLDCCRKTRQQQQTMVYIQQTPAQVVPQQLTFQQFNQPQMASPQFVVPADPPPPYAANAPPLYTSLIHEPTVNRPTNVTRATPVNMSPPAALTSPSAPPLEAGDAFPQPVEFSRIQNSALPPDQPQLEPEYLEPNNQGSQQGDVSTYVIPDGDGPPRSDTSYLTPNVQQSPYYSSYVVSNDESRHPQNENAYVEPNPIRSTQGDRNEAFLYDYADPMDEERHRAGQNAEDDYVEVIP